MLGNEGRKTQCCTCLCKANRLGQLFGQMVNFLLYCFALSQSPSATASTTRRAQAIAHPTDAVWAAPLQWGQQMRQLEVNFMSLQAAHHH